MGRFLNGVLVGIGIGLLVAPMKGEEMRRQVRERFQELQSRLPDNEQLKQTGQQMAAGVSQTASRVNEYTQHAASKVQDTASNVGNLAQKTASEVKQTGQDVASTTKQTAASMKQGGQTPTLTPDQGMEEPIIFVDDMALDEGR